MHDKTADGEPGRPGTRARTGDNLFTNSIDARFLGDEIVRLANEEKDPRQALQLAARAQNLFRCQRSTVRRPQASLPVCSR
jgi:hypothetical protein